MAQLIMMYFFTGRLKTGAAWVETYTALEQALRLDQFTREPGYWLLNYPQLLKTLTWSTLILEKWAWLLLFTPVFFGPVRFLVVLMFIGFHLGIQSTMSLGSFQWICMMAWTLLLPQWFWDNLLPWAEQRLQMIASCRIGVCTWIEGLATRAMGTRKSVPFTSWSWSSTVGGALGCFIALHLVLLWNLREDPGLSLIHI